LRGYDDEGVKKDVDLKNKSILSLKNIKKTSSREIVE
jgi:DNA polymerase eta